MRISITRGDDCVEIETTEQGMTAQRLANIAVKALQETARVKVGPLHGAYGFSSQLQYRSGFHRTGPGRRGFREVEDGE